MGRRAPRPRRRPLLSALVAGLALVALAGLAGSAAAQRTKLLSKPGPGPTTLLNDHVRYVFDTKGGHAQLARIVNRSPLLAGHPDRTLVFDTSQEAGDGGWTLVFARKSEYDEGDPESPTRRYRVEADGDHGVAGGPGTAPDLVMETPLIEADPLVLTGRRLERSWRCQLVLGDATTSETIRLRVTVQWLLAADAPWADASLHVQYVDTPPERFHLARASFPELELRRFADRTDPPGPPADALMTPILGGYLLRRPTDPAVAFPEDLVTMPFHTQNGETVPNWSVPLLAYSEELSESGLFVMTTDGGEQWKQLFVERTPDGGESGRGPERGRLLLGVSHVPEDTYDNAPKLEPGGWQPPYAVRVGAFVGDWWDVAEIYRQHLRDTAPWFGPPVSSPSHTMPAPIKEIVAEMYLVPSRAGDSMSLSNRLMADVHEVLGRGVTTTWYGWHYPDVFGEYFADGYLPGRPSLAASVRESQAQGDTITKLYMNGLAAKQNAGITPCESSIQGSFLRTAKGGLMNVSATEKGGRVLCTGTATWQDHLPRAVLGTAAFTEMRGVYLDFLFPAACFSGEHGHPPGGGDWMVREPLEAIQALTGAGVPDLGATPPDCAFLPATPPVAPADFLVSIEGLTARWTESVHLMHRDPARLRVLGSQGEFIDTATSIPLFHAIFDNVKVGRIRAAPSTRRNVGRQCWIEASTAFRFGQLLHPGEGNLDVLQAFNARAQADYFGFLGELAHVLRDRGLGLWWDGTLRRPPRLEVLDPPTDWADSSTPTAQFDLHTPTSNPNYVNEMEGSTWVVGSVFQAPPDAPGADANSLALVFCNPWVAEDQQDFLIEAEIDLSGYPGWEDTQGADYTVERHSSFEPDPVSLPPAVSPRFGGQDIIETGEVVWYVFRR